MKRRKAAQGASLQHFFFIEDKGCFFTSSLSKMKMKIKGASLQHFFFIEDEEKGCFFTSSLSKMKRKGFEEEASE